MGEDMGAVAPDEHAEPPHAADVVDHVLDDEPVTHTIYDPDVSELGLAIAWATLEDEGATLESVIDVLVERIEGFQAGDLACAENSEALDHLRAARAALDLRTARRKAQGVEASMAKHESAG